MRGAWCFVVRGHGHSCSSMLRAMNCILDIISPMYHWISPCDVLVGALFTFAMIPHYFFCGDDTSLLGEPVHQMDQLGQDARAGSLPDRRVRYSGVGQSAA